MKIQDIGFFLAFFIILIARRPRWLLVLGLACWILAIPLFARWVFFTAERLTWYGSGYMFFYMLSVLLGSDEVE